MSGDDYRSGSAAATESVFSLTATVCLILGLLSGMLLDGGWISSWAPGVFLPIFGYLTLRLTIWKLVGRMPPLTPVQAGAVYLAPVYGFLIGYGAMAVDMLLWP